MDVPGKSVGSRLTSLHLRAPLLGKVIDVVDSEEIVRKVNPFGLHSCSKYQNPCILVTIVVIIGPLVVQIFIEKMGS